MDCGYIFEEILWWDRVTQFIFSNRFKELFITVQQCFYFNLRIFVILLS